MNSPYRRAYDHRLCDLVCEERNPALLAQLGIPRSTAASWIRRGSRSIVTSKLFGQDEQALRARVLKLERHVQLLLGIVRLLFAVVRLFGFRLDSRRVPSGETKSTILGAIDREAHPRGARTLMAAGFSHESGRGRSLELDQLTRHPPAARWRSPYPSSS